MATSLSPPTNSQRKLTRARQLRHLRGCDVKHLEYFLNSPVRHRNGDVAEDVDLLRSASAPSPHPLPLPLPDLSALFCSADRVVNRRDKLRLKAKANGCDVDGFRLPSPTGVVKERDRLDEKAASPNNTRNIIQDNPESVSAQRRVDARRRTDSQREADSHLSIHRAETWSASDVPQKMGTVNARDKLPLDSTYGSAPSSANASPMVSPQRLLNADIFSSYHGEPKCWSDPVMPSSLPHTECVKHSLSGDSSPLHNPLVRSFIRPRKSTSGPASPRHPKLHIDISSCHNDSNVFMNVHPLPLPPTPVSSAQLSPLPQGPSKPEYLPVKSQWKKGKLIGRGTFGSVYVATNQETGALCAMKEVELCPDDSKSAECITQLEQEIKVLSDLKHPNIVQYYGSEIVDDRFYIYLEYVYPGSINKYVREHCGAVTEAVVRNFTRHICSGLAFLHGRKTIHRDIKGANLLVDLSGVVKLADFGMAKHLTGQAAELSLKGSPYWMAPELMQSVMQKDNSSDLAFAVDIWSLGCTIIEMLTGKPPWSDYEGPAAMFKVLRESPPVPETLSPEGKDFLNCCFRRNPADRPPAYKLLDHPFLRNSQQLDVPSSSSALDFFYQTDKARTPRELYNHRLDKVPMSPGRWKTNTKTSINDTGLLPRLETSDIILGRRHSPRSILEPLISQSPSQLSPPPKLLLSVKP